MTKQIRIENADTSNYSVTVEVWDMTVNGPVLADTYILGHPTAMKETYITSTRYLVVRETGTKLRLDLAPKLWYN